MEGMVDIPSQISAHVERQRRLLPEDPGVYLYHDAAGAVLYVGKAKNLRKRVNSYFTKALDARKHAMVLRIANIEVFSVSSEQEALAFEERLIKLHRPPFNVMLRDDKSYPYIVVTLDDEFPRVMLTRDRKRKTGNRYFGPYTSAKRVRSTLDLLNRVFPYRPCEGKQPGRQSGVPCLDYHIERCSAPCVGYISQEKYREIIDEVITVLEGKDQLVRARLTKQMKEASGRLDFERAARLRNRLTDLDQVAQLQQTERPGEGSFDVLGVEVSDELANVQLLQVRDGHLHDRRSVFLERVDGVKSSAVLAQFVLSNYSEGRPVPRQIVTKVGSLSADDMRMLHDELSRVRGAAVEVRAAQRGEKRRLADLAQRNAEQALTYDALQQRASIERRQLALEQLRDVLDLEVLPLRIECYDISNLQDESPVASMVVLEDAQPLKDHYRKFAMRYEGGQDDFAMMHEVILRRFTRLQSGDKDESFSSIPNLVIIDGGKGQLGAALSALQSLNIERVPVVSLAKREELVFVPNRRAPIELERRSPALHLVQRIRDEAHRFALGYHRKRRAQDDRTGKGSILDTLDGVGDARRRALLTFFGSPERVVSASIEELEAVPGLPGKVARDIHAQLHRFGGASPAP